MKLVYLLQGARWFVAHDDAWFRLESEAEAELAGAVMALDLVDLYELVEQPPQAGVARVAHGPEAATVRLVATDGALVAETDLAYDARALTRVEWLVRPFRDGWHPSETRLLVEGAGAYALKLYLPPRPDAGPKALRLRDGDEGTERTVSLDRGAENLVPLFDDAAGERRVIHLACDAEPGTTNDARSLGFVLIDDVLQAA